MSTVRAESTLYLGIDLGGTRVKAGLGERGRELFWQDEGPSSARDGPEAVLDALWKTAEGGVRFARAHGVEIAGIGLATPGIVNSETGTIVHDPANLPGWKGWNLRQALSERSGLPVVIENDANAAAYGEAAVRGALARRASLVMVTVGTGIGGGAILGGELLRGSRGAGMELGHIPFGADHRRCSCGRSDCLEAYAGGWAMRQAFAESRAQEREESPNSGPTLRDLLEAARTGDPRARQILQDGAEALGTGLVVVLHLLNPETLVLGGGVVAGYPPFAEEVERTLRRRALPKALDGLSVQEARLRNRAGVWGALALAQEQRAREENGS